jgi:hypothetical protein
MKPILDPFLHLDTLICDVRNELVEVAETEGEVAGDIVATVIGHVIKALRADHSIPARSLTEWEDFFVDAARDATDDLWRLEGLIQPQEAIWAIEQFYSIADREVGAPQASDATVLQFPPNPDP